MKFFYKVNLVKLAFQLRRGEMGALLDFVFFPAFMIGRLKRRLGIGFLNKYLQFHFSGLRFCFLDLKSMFFPRLIISLYMAFGSYSLIVG